ncbi:MAG: hypothetical protein ACRC2T_08590, partial [Thermoguttaceae bacterium]
VGMSACGCGFGNCGFGNCAAVGFSGGVCEVSACEPACAPACEPACAPACEPACAPVCEPACVPACEPACGQGCLGNHSFGNGNLGNGGIIQPAPFFGKRQETAPTNYYVTRGPRDFFDPNPNKIRY